MYMIMRTSNFLRTSLWTGLLAVGLAACSGDGVTNEPPSQKEVTPEARGYITLSINPPTSGSVVYGREVQTVEEASVYEVRVYFFTHDDTTEEGDEHYVFTTAGTTTWKNADGSPLLGTNGMGIYSKRIDIPEDLKGETVKIMLLANDPGAVFGNDVIGTTLAEFKQKIWSNSLSGSTISGYYSHEIVEIDGQRRFSMSAMAQKYTEGSTSGPEAITLPSDDNQVKVTATLVRNVARVDIFNHTPNLTLTAALLYNTPTQTYLFPTEPLSTPTTTGWTVFAPISEYFNGQTELPYVTGGEQANTKTAFYMYEQPATDDPDKALKLTLGYQLEIEGNKRKGTLDVFFKSSSTQQFIDLKRNHRYTIVIGGGQPVTSLANMVFRLVDWETQDVMTELDTDNDTQVPNP